MAAGNGRRAFQVKEPAQGKAGHERNPRKNAGCRDWGEEREAGLCNVPPLTLRCHPQVGTSLDSVPQTHHPGQAPGGAGRSKMLGASNLSPKTVGASEGPGTGPCEVSYGFSESPRLCGGLSEGTEVGKEDEHQSPPRCEARSCELAPLRAPGWRRTVSWAPPPAQLGRRNVLTERNTDRKIQLHVKGISSISRFLITFRWFEISAWEPQWGNLGSRAEVALGPPGLREPGSVPGGRRGPLSGPQPLARARA